MTIEPALKCYNPSTGTGFEITKIPGRKQVSLCLCRPGNIIPIAYFRSEPHAIEFIIEINKLVDAAQAGTMCRVDTETDMEGEE